MANPRNEWLEMIAGPWETDDYSLVLVDDTYTYDAAHDRLSDVDADARIVTVALTGKTATGPVLTADNPGVVSAAPAKRIIGAWVYRDTGVDATSVLVRWIDHALDGSSIDFTTNGEDFELLLPGPPKGMVKI